MAERSLPISRVPVSSRGERRLSRGPVGGSLIVLVVLAVACAMAGVATVVSRDQLQRAGRGVHAARPASASPAQPSSSATVRNPEPRALTLTAGDLPPGFHVLKEGPAAFNAGSAGARPPSWDVVFEPGPGQQSGYQLAESLAIVYPTRSLAADAVDSQASLERAARATQQTPSIGVGDRVTIWREQVSARPQAVIVRVTWQSLNIVGQVSLLEPAGSGYSDLAERLAISQQERIGAPAPTKSP